jgi:hypothetical protein
MGRRARALMVALAVGMVGMTAALVPAIGAAAGGEAPLTVLMPVEVPANLEFQVSPKRLPPDEPGPTRLTIGVEVNPTQTGEAPPGISEARIGLDRSVGFEPRGLPACRWPGVEGGIQIDSVGDECARAVIGRAEGSILFTFPDNAPITVPGKGTVYSGGVRRGGTALLVAIPFSNPLSGILRLVIPVRPVRDGQIGSVATIRVPKLGGGYGMLLDLHLELERRFVSARCRDGKLLATLGTVFTDGTEGSAESTRACTRAVAG